MSAGAAVFMPVSGVDEKVVRGVVIAVSEVEEVDVEFLVAVPGRGVTMAVSEEDICVEFVGAAPGRGVPWISGAYAGPVNIG